MMPKYSNTVARATDQARRQVQADAFKRLHRLICILTKIDKELDRRRAAGEFKRQR